MLKCISICNREYEKWMGYQKLTIVQQYGTFNRTINNSMKDIEEEVNPDVVNKCK